MDICMELSRIAKNANRHDYPVIVAAIEEIESLRAVLAEMRSLQIAINKLPAAVEEQ